MESETRKKELEKCAKYIEGRVKCMAIICNGRVEPFTIDMAELRLEGYSGHFEEKSFMRPKSYYVRGKMTLATRLEEMLPGEIHLALLKRYEKEEHGYRSGSVELEVSTSPAYALKLFQDNTIDDAFRRSLETKRNDIIYDIAEKTAPVLGWKDLLYVMSNGIYRDDDEDISSVVQYSDFGLANLDSFRRCFILAQAVSDALNSLDSVNKEWSFYASAIVRRDWFNVSVDAAIRKKALPKENEQKILEEW